MSTVTASPIHPTLVDSIIGWCNNIISEFNRLFDFLTNNVDYKDLISKMIKIASIFGQLASVLRGVPVVLKS